MSLLKSLLLLTTVGCFYAKNGDVAACRYLAAKQIKRIMTTNRQTH